MAYSMLTPLAIHLSREELRNLVQDSGAIISYEEGDSMMTTKQPCHIKRILGIVVTMVIVALTSFTEAQGSAANQRTELLPLGLPWVFRLTRLTARPLLLVSMETTTLLTSFQLAPLSRWDSRVIFSSSLQPPRQNIPLTLQICRNSNPTSKPASESSTRIWIGGE